MSTSEKRSGQLFEQFERLAEAMNVLLVQDRGDFEGGLCILEQRPYIVLNQLKPLSQRLRVLALSFNRLGLYNRYVAPVLREYIQSVLAERSFGEELDLSTPLSEGHVQT